MPKPPARPQSQPSVTKTEQHLVVRQGPLPTPHELSDYDRFLPGSANRIIAMAERDQAHRMNLEDMAQRADIQHRNEVMESQRRLTRGAFTSDMIGQAFGAVIAAGCVAGAIFTAYIGASPFVSIALVSLPVATIIKAIRSIEPKDKKPK